MKLLYFIDTVTKTFSTPTFIPSAEEAKEFDFQRFLFSFCLQDYFLCEKMQDTLDNSIDVLSKPEDFHKHFLKFHINFKVVTCELEPPEEVMEKRLTRLINKEFIVEPFSFYLDYEVFQTLCTSMLNYCKMIKNARDYIKKGGDEDGRSKKEQDS